MPLVRDAALSAALLPADLQAGHRLAAEFLRRTDETDAIAIAEHSGRGGDLPAAAEWLARAARRPSISGDLRRPSPAFGGAMAHEKDEQAQQYLRSWSWTRSAGRAVCISWRAVPASD